MDLTQGNIRKQLISMAVPAGIGMLFYTLYNVVDTFYAGLISTEALAGLAISFPVFSNMKLLNVKMCVFLRTRIG